MPQDNKGYNRRFTVVDTPTREIQTIVNDTLEKLTKAGLEKNAQQIYREGIKNRCLELQEDAKNLIEQSAA